MKNKTLFVLVVAVIGFVLYSCEEFVERDISKQWVYATAPSDFSSSNVLTQTLKWKEVEGATAYNLQIFKTKNKEYQEVVQFIADTTVKITQFTYTFKPGFYKWRVYGKNNGSETGISEFRFQIDSTGDISNQKVILLWPTNNKISDSLDQTFNWITLSNAKSYNLQIYPINGTTAIYSTIVSAPPAPYKFKSGGNYRWRVSAMNGSVVSPFSEFNLNIDTLRLPAPLVISPKNDTTLIGSPVQLKWNAVANATQYKVQIAEDSTSSPTPVTSNTTSYNFDNSVVSKKYYWRVKALKGSQEGDYSSWWMFRRN